MFFCNRYKTLLVGSIGTKDKAVAMVVEHALWKLHTDLGYDLLCAPHLGPCLHCMKLSEDGQIRG